MANGKHTSDLLLYLADPDVTRLRHVRQVVEGLWTAAGLCSRVVSSYGPRHSGQVQLAIRDVLALGCREQVKLDELIDSSKLFCLLAAAWLQDIGWPVIRPTEAASDISDFDAEALRRSLRPFGCKYLEDHTEELGLRADEVASLFSMLGGSTLEAATAVVDPAARRWTDSLAIAVLRMADSLDLSDPASVPSCQSCTWSEAPLSVKWNTLRRWCVVHAEPYHELRNAGSKSVLSLTYQAVVRLPDFRYRDAFWTRLIRPVERVAADVYSELEGIGLSVAADHFQCMPLMCRDALPDGTPVAQAFQDVFGSGATDALALPLAELRERNAVAASMIEKSFRALVIERAISGQTARDLEVHLGRYLTDLQQSVDVDAMYGARDRFRVSLGTILRQIGARAGGTENAGGEALKLAELAWRLAAFCREDPAGRATQLEHLCGWLGTETNELLRFVAVKDPSDEVRRSAVRHLAEFGTAESFQAVLQASCDRDGEVRIEAIRALQQLAGPGSYKRLVEILDGDVDGAVRRTAAAALRSLVERATDVHHEFAGRKVLFLSDEGSVIPPIVDALERRGIETRVATTHEGIEALLVSWQPDVTVCSLRFNGDVQSGPAANMLSLAHMIRDRLGLKVQLLAISQEEPGVLWEALTALRAAYVRLPTTVDSAVRAIESLFSIPTSLGLAASTPVADRAPNSRVRWVLLVPTADEFIAVSACLNDMREPSDQTMPTKIGFVGRHTVACVMSGKGEPNTASALQYVISKIQPRWVVLVGIAGGFPDQGIHRGDVVIGSYIYHLDFGKVKAGKYIHRPEYDYAPDRSLLSHAEVLAAEVNQESRVLTSVYRPDSLASNVTRIHVGYIASSDKIVDDPDSRMFKAMRAAVPEIHAVEMEAAGAGAAVRLAQSNRTVGFLTIRGISDEPSEAGTTGTEQRKQWKHYATSAAVGFLQQLLLALPPAFGGVRIRPR